MSRTSETQLVEGLKQLTIQVQNPSSWIIDEEEERKIAYAVSEICATFSAKVREIMIQTGSRHYAMTINVGFDPDHESNKFTTELIQLMIDSVRKSVSDSG